MREDKFTAKLSAWLDHELSPTEVVELKHHLADCAACQQTYQAMQQLDQQFRQASLDMAVPVVGFSQRFEARLSQHQTEKRQAWLAILALFLGATLFFIMLIAGSFDVLSYSWPTWQQSQIGFIHWINTAHSWLNLLAVLVKACLIMMSQPLFWGIAAMSLVVTGLWGRVMQVLYQQSGFSSPMLS